MKDNQFTPVAVNTRFSHFAEINAYNQKFWEEQNRLESERIEQKDLYERAFERLCGEMQRLQIRDQHSWAYILQEAEKDRKCYRTFQTRKARNAVKTNDLLNEFIDRLVQQDPFISQQEVIHALKRPNSDFTFSIDFIGWTNNSGKNKSAPVKSLKDRLSRAKQRKKA